MELTLDKLMTLLRDSSTVVRYSSAKYIARITNRLPKELASDVISHVIELCEWRDSDSSWHGSCLAMAELARRGLVLPQHLDDVVDIVEKALIFDEIKGKTPYLVLFCNSENLISFFKVHFQSVRT